MDICQTKAAREIKSGFKKLETQMILLGVCPAKDTQQSLCRRPQVHDLLATYLVTLQG